MIKKRKSTESSVTKDLPDGYRRLTMVISENHHKAFLQMADRRGTKLYLMMGEAFKKYIEFFGG